MRFKLDENIDVRLATWIAERGHDISTVRAQGISGADDEEIYEICRRERRTLVSLDLDFSNHLRFPPLPTDGIVVLRPHRPTIPLIMALLKNVVPTLEDESLQGKLAIAEVGRLRIYESGTADEKH